MHEPFSLPLRSTHHPPPPPAASADPGACTATKKTGGTGGLRMRGIAHAEPCRRLAFTSSCADTDRCHQGTSLPRRNGNTRGSTSPEQSRRRRLRWWTK
eukprot:scaffold32301_cov135-Isochrysis_galbana.AAC.9